MPPPSLAWARPTPYTAIPRPRFVTEYLIVESEAFRIYQGRLLKATDGRIADGEDVVRHQIESFLDDLLGQVEDDLAWCVGEWWRDQPSELPAAEADNARAWWLFLLLILRRKLHRSDPAVDRYHPLYARALFLLLSVPFRSGEPEVVDDFDLAKIAMQARRAREQWARHLDRLNDHPLTETLTPRDIDNEVDTLIWRDAPVAELLMLTGPSPDGGQGDTGTSSALSHISHYAFLKWVVRRLLLPRFRVGDCRRIVARMQQLQVTTETDPTLSEIDRRARSAEQQWARNAPTAGAVLVLALFLWTVSGFFGVDPSPLNAVGAAGSTGLVAWVIALAAAPYGLALAGTLAGGAEVSYPFLLRMPAVSALGASVLFALGVPWYAEQHWLVAAAAIAVSLCYLLLEARNHNVSGVGRRAVAVLCIGLGHGLCVAVLWLAIAGEVFLTPLECSAALHHPSCSQGSEWVAAGDVLSDPALAASTIALVASIGSLLGLILQVLWDDRPITYPLMHLGGDS